MAYTFRHGDRPIPRITIQRAVGRGGFGEVYYALADSGKQLAVKYLRENPEVELRGISQVMNLKSPHLITIYDVVRNADGEPFVLMEYVSGPSLRDLINAEPNGLGPQKAAFFLKGIGAGLSYLHERGIVHRDLKPGNIFYDDGYVKIGDYGLSKHISVSAHSGNTISVGTVHYMAPEIGSGSYSKAIDIYALGVILYELLTGRLPYTGASMGEVLMRHLNDRPDLVGIPEPFRSVIAKALAKDPAERYQDVNQMVDAVLQVGDIDEQIRSFNPETLTQVPRGAVTDAAATRTAAGTPPVPGPLDARDAQDLPLIPPGTAPDRKQTRRQRRLERKLEHHARQAERIRARIEGKSNKSSILAMLVPTVAIGVGIGLISDVRNKEDAAISMAFMLVGAVAGPLIVYFRVLPRLAQVNQIMRRLLYAAGGLACMMPGMSIAADNVRPDDYALIALALVATLVVFDWHRRIEEGRRGRVKTTTAILPAMIGLVAGAIATDGEFVLQSAAACGALALLLPSAAGLFPIGGAQTTDISTAAVPVGVDAPAAPPPPPESPRAPHRAAQPAAGIEPSDEPPAAPVTGQMPASQGTTSLPPRPSLLARIASAGLSLAGKAFILLGFVLAFGHNYTYRLTPDESTEILLGPAQIQVVEHGRTQVDFAMPKWVAIMPFLAGLALLLSARRNDGALHLLRGLIGCISGIAAAILALGPAAKALELIFDDRWSELGQMSSDTVTAMIVLASLSFVLIFWPKRTLPRSVVVV